jgi:hypothetical protein
MGEGLTLERRYGMMGHAEIKIKSETKTKEEPH